VHVADRRLLLTGHRVEARTFAEVVLQLVGFLDDRIGGGLGLDACLSGDRDAGVVDTRDGGARSTYQPLEDLFQGLRGVQGTSCLGHGLG